jgi:tRNA C32,U32 (ribose-2'-O)-methylase TrmJ
VILIFATDEDVENLIDTCNKFCDDATPIKDKDKAKNSIEILNDVMKAAQYLNANPNEELREKLRAVYDRILIEGFRLDLDMVKDSKGRP